MSILIGRRSIRKYTNKKITSEQIKIMLQAGMSAPSAFDRRPWQFIVIDDRTKLDKIPTFHQYANMLKEASAAIVVCGDTKNLASKEEWIMGCSAAAQNILLSAYEIGLGSVWVGIFPDEARITELRKLVGIPDDFIPLCILPVGHPAETKKHENRFDSSKVHINQW